MKSPRFGKGNLKRMVQKSDFARFFAHSFTLFALIGLGMVNGLPPSVARAQSANTDRGTPTYIDLAARFADAPIVAHVRVRKIQWIREKPSSTPPAAGPENPRALVTADVVSLLKAPAPLAPRLRFLMEIPEGQPARDRPGRKQKDIIISARPVKGRDDEIQLLTIRQPLGWTAELENRVRAIISQFTAPAAPSAITAITSAFYAPGPLIGDSDSQFFLATVRGTPVSIFVVRRADTAARWGAAFGDTVSSDSPPPQADTAEWYRLACGLPRTLPENVLSGASVAEHEGIMRDYQWVLQQLPRCSTGSGVVTD